MIRELDILIAEKVMGFRREKTPPDINGEFGGEDILVPPNIDHKTWNYPPRGRIGLGYHVTRPYSSDLNAAHEVEEMIYRRCLEGQYYGHLFDIVGKNATGFDLIHASAEQRCLAAIKTVESI